MCEIRKLNGTRQKVSAYEQGMVVARRTGLSVSRTATLLCFSDSTVSCVSRMVHLPNGHPANLTQLQGALESTWASNPVEHFQHLVFLKLARQVS